MFKNKPTRIALLAILASLLSYSIAQACSPVMPTILVKCSNLEVSIVANTPRVEGDSYDDAQKRWANDTINNLYAVVQNCAEDLTPVLDSFEQEIVKWLDYKNNKRGAFLDGDLILEPYSANRNSELQKKKNDLSSCSYEEFNSVGNWLIIFETSRPYCYTFWHTPGMCPSIILSLGHFLFYLVTSFSLTALPYLIALLVAGAIIIYAWWKFLNNRPALKLWRVVVLTIVVLVAELFMIVMPVWLFIQIIGWISLFGILVLWYKYFQNTKYVAK